MLRRLKLLWKRIVVGMNILDISLCNAMAVSMILVEIALIVELNPKCSMWPFNIDEMICLIELSDGIPRSNVEKWRWRRGLIGNEPAVGLVQDT